MLLADVITKRFRQHSSPFGSLVGKLVEIFETRSFCSWASLTEYPCPPNSGQEIFSGRNSIQPNPSEIAKNN